MQRFMSIDSGSKLHSLLLQHHVNKQTDGVASPGSDNVPVFSPPHPGAPQNYIPIDSPINSPLPFPAAGNIQVSTKQRGRIAGTFANLFARKGANE